MNVEDDVPEQVQTDQKRFRQILFNLIGNAVKFTFHGSISINVKFNNAELVCAVEDTGIGIKEDDLHRLFRFFGQITKSKNINRGGMGLGLTLSKMILQ
jgi:signal transduction histidine kinase